MADNTAIEWCDATWQPITGCSVVSPGCTNCYAMRLAGTRLRHHMSRQGLTRDSRAGPVWTGEVRLNEDWLDQPLRWKRARRIFVCAHGDLFAEGVPDDWIDRVFAVMALAPQHIFLVLTKRAYRLRDYMRSDTDTGGKTFPTIRELARSNQAWSSDTGYLRWPLPNVWIGVSVEDQARADERIPLLLDTPAAIRFLSCEPLLGEIDLRGWEFDARGKGFPPDETGPGLDWVIVGGESGPGARPMHPDWPRALRDQCQAAGVPFFFKQWGSWIPDRLCDRLRIRGVMLRADGTRPTDADLNAIMEGRFDWSAPDWQHFSEVGKKAAGRLLDGREHSEIPAGDG